MAVFVLDTHKRPLMPCSEKRARLLLERSRAVVHRRYPFTIRLKDRIGGAVQPMRITLDPGASTTGVALVREREDGPYVLHLAEIVHRGTAIHKKMQQRAAFRRRRRSAHLRYRKTRFENRTRPEGWLPPSLKSRVDNSAGWVDRYRRLAPVSAISVEHVRFDMQKIQNPGAGRADDREKGRSPYRQGGCPCHGSFQHPDAEGRGTGYLVEALYAPEPCRWIRIPR